MSLTVIRYQHFGDAGHAWEQVLAADHNATFFSTPAWLHTWWEHHGNGRELLLLAVMNGDAIIGFAPLMMQPVVGARQVAFLGSGLSDYADFLVDDHQPNRREVVTAILSFLAGEFPDAMFDFQQIPQDSPSIDIMAAWAKESRLAGYTVLPQDICPVINLPEVPEEYHKQLKKSFLADLRRGERRLRERGTVTIIDHVTPPGDDDWTTLRDQMSELQSQRMRTKGEIPLWQGPLGAFVKDVLRNADRAGNLRLTCLYLDDRMLAYELCFVHQKTMYAWSRAFDEEYRNTGPGKIALLHLLETAIRQGYQLFDLLRGEEPYKALWTNGAVQNYRAVFVVRPSLAARANYKFVTDWKGRLQNVQWMHSLYRRLKALRSGAR